MVRVILISVRRYWRWLTAAILLAITVLSLTPLSTLPAAPGSDKAHHFIAYATLMLPTALRRPKHWGLIGLGFIGYSGLIELIQPTVNRYGEWLDLLANAVGVLLGAAIGYFLSRFTDIDDVQPPPQTNNHKR